MARDKLATISDDVEVDGRHVYGRVARAGKAVPGLLRDLEASGVGLEGIEVIRPTLDDVFLTLTGRSLRDADEAADPETTGPEGERAVTTYLRECSVVFRRQIRMNLRNPAWVLIGIMQPVLYLLLFGPLLKPLVAQFDTGTDNAYTFLVPGLLVQLGMFGAFFAGFSLIGEWREGVIEAERVTPAARSALLVGRLWRDVLQLLVQALILVALAYVIGMRGSIGGVVLGIVITLLVGGACAAASNALAMATKSEDVMAPVINVVMMPILLLSGILLPMTLGADWLQRISDFMPFRYIVDAARDAFTGDLGSSDVVWGTGLGGRDLRARDVVGRLGVPQGERVTARSRPRNEAGSVGRNGSSGPCGRGTRSQPGQPRHTRSRRWD